MTHEEYARNYKRTVAGKYMLVDGSKIMEKIGGADFCATRKYDGIMQVVFVEKGHVSAFGSGGNQTPEELPCLKEFAELMEAVSISDAVFGAELYATISVNGRERVADVAKCIADPLLQDQLHLAVFDIMEISGGMVDCSHYKEKLARLRSLFQNGDLVRAVAGKTISSKGELNALFENVVTSHGAEGLVVHNDGPVVYKIKPRHSIDVAVIGYTVGEDTRNEMVRDLLCAVIHPDGTLRQIASVGAGLSNEMRAELYRRLFPLQMESDYVETDSRNVAFIMVRPELVLEISAVDYVTENAAGESKQNMLLHLEEGRYIPMGKAPGVVLHSPVVLRERTDKKADSQDVRLSQITDLCDFGDSKTINCESLPQSELLERRVFMKQTGFKRMVQKFVVWKTNKEASGKFPAYVLHHTDYNYSRREQLRRDLRVSSSQSQIMQLLSEMIEVNIKKGWEEIL